MSQGSKITLLASLAVSSYIIGYVHFKQSDDKKRLHQGVIRDMARQQQRHDQITASNSNNAQSLNETDLELTNPNQLKTN